MLTLSLVAVAQAWSVKTTDDGDPVSWPGFPVAYTWDGGEIEGVDDPAGLLQDAFAAWGRVPGSPVSFDAAPGQVAHPREANDDTNLIWVTTDWPYDEELLALTSSWATDDGEIVGFDIRINGNQPWSSDGDPSAYDFRAALTHEAGHVLGLDHSQVEDATMFATAARGEGWRAELTSDDEDGLHYLYPAFGDRHGGSFPLSCSTAPAGAAGTLLPLALTTALLRRSGGSRAALSRRDRRLRLHVRAGARSGRAGRAVEHGGGGSGR